MPTRQSSTLPEHRKEIRWYDSGVAVLALICSVKPELFKQVLSGHTPYASTRLGRLRVDKHEFRTS